MAQMTKSCILKVSNAQPNQSHVYAHILLKGPSIQSFKGSSSIEKERQDVTSYKLAHTSMFSSSKGDKSERGTIAMHKAGSAIHLTSMILEERGTFHGRTLMRVSAHVGRQERDPVGEWGHTCML